ncbi:MAG: outer membrane beta-barrel protein [Bacteroidales bacterium]
MKQIFLLFTFLLCFNFYALSQHSIQSTVFDSKNGQPIEMGNVRLIKTSDSTFVQGTQTDSKGSFNLSKIKSGNYTLIISFLGYNDYKKNLTVESKNLILKNIQLIENAVLLGEVEVKGTAAQMVVKGDTTEFNANAFKTTQNAVVEDLLKRLPGVVVSTEGKITVNGEEVKKIRVNGKKFFNDDVEMATKNIPAELIDKIQVLDQKSDMALLTGFEDNDTERIINLTFKANRKKGTFGNVTGGAGLDTQKAVRYDGNMFLNMIDGEAQTTITSGANNTNTSRSSRGRGGFGNNSGITSIQNIGVNNNTIINPNFKIGGDGSFNHANNLSITESNRESYLKDSKYTNDSKTNASSDNYSANMRLEAEWKLDSLNTIIFQPNISYNRGFNDTSRDYNYQTDSVKTSEGSSHNYGNSTSLDGGITVIYNHKFASKKGRTFTTNFQTGISQSNSENFNISDKFSFITNTLTKINQRTDNVSNRYNTSIRMSFVEPLWNYKNFLETSVSLRSTKNMSEKEQFYRDVLGNDSLKNLEYSNNFENLFFSETLEFNYRYVFKSLNVTLGMKAEPSQTYSTRIYANDSIIPITNEVINFAPNGRFQYNFGKKNFVRIDYRGQTEQPSINQMQPVKNNSNLMNETVGNPTLNPSFNHRMYMMYTSFNDKTFSSFNTTFSFRATKDALLMNSIYDTTGKQYSQTVNARTGEIPYSINGNVMFNTPIIQKRLHFNTSTSGSYDKQYGYSSKGLTSLNTDSIIPLGDLSNTSRYSAGEQLSLTFTHDVIEIGAKGSFRYSNTWNNLSRITAVTKDWSGGGNVILHLPYNINIGTDLNFTTLQGYVGFDKNQLIWNATIDKTLFNSRGVLSFKVNDILRQQLNIRQSIGDNYIQYNSYNTLTSYFLLSFTYKINKFAGTKNPADRKPDFERFGGHDHPRGEGGFRGGDRQRDF